MVDVLTVGAAGLQSVRNHTQRTHQVIHAHRAMHAAFTRNPKHGISMMALAKIHRLIGVDQLHIGTAHIGKMQGKAGEVVDIENALETRNKKGVDALNSLNQRWYNIKPVLAVASGGLHPGMIPALMKKMGKDIVAQFGGGCHGHPDGTYTGAKAIRQALTAAMKNIPLQRYAKDHEELRSALKLWG